MDTSLLRIRRTKSGYYASLIFPVLVALAAGPGTLQATTPVLSFYTTATGGTAITAITLACSTQTGSVPQTIYVAEAATASITFTLASANSALIAVSPTSTQTVSTTTTRIPFTLTLAAGCAGLTNNGTVALTIAGGNATGTLTATTTVAATTSGLSVPSTVNLTCTKNGSTYYPGAAQTVSVSSTATGGTPFSYDSSGGEVAAAWLTLNPVAPSGTATSGSPVTFTVAAAAGCDALPSTPGSNTATTTVHLLNAPGPEVAITVTLTVSAPSASSLVVSPSSITITCARSTSGVYSPSYPQTVSVTAPSATAFTVDDSVNPYASWLNVTPLTGGTATSSPISFTVAAAAGCGGFALNSVNTTVVHLVNSPALDKLFTVTLQIVPATILTATPDPATLTYVKGSGTAGYVDVNIGSSSSAVPNPFFTINTATLPIWLRLDSTSGTAPQSLRFSSTTVADTLAPGTYSATIVISVSGYGDLNLPVSMLLTNKAPQLTVQAPPASETCTPASATTFCIPWTIGQGLPTPTITAISTDTPISYTATTGGLLAPVIPTSEQNGLAYSFGTPINVTFNPEAFAAAQPGTVLTGTVTLTWGSPVSTVVVTFDVTVLSPGATISSVSPASLPVASVGTTYTVAVTGTGFVPGTIPAQSTRVGVVTTNGSPMVFDTNIQTNIINQSNITLSITVPAGTDSSIPFSGGSFNIGVCNPVGGTCTVATSEATLTIGTNPIIQAVTSSSSLLQGQSVSVAPYDMISIFGANFCPSCTSTQVLTGTPDPVTLTYPAALPFDGSHALTVTFQTHSGATFIANAPILFATNSQINLMVPSAVTTGVATDIVVSYGSGNLGSVTQKSSTPFTVAIANTDPGVFTIGADGQGSGAALDVNYNLISAGNPAGIRTGSNQSDIVSLYMTGLGAPDSTADNSSAASDGGGNGLVWSADCVTTTSYLSSFNAAQTGTALTSLDGTLIIPSVLNTGRLVPCILSADNTAVTIGGQPATVTYAGWVPGTIAGLYQINVQLPTNTSGAFTTEAGLTNQSITTPVQLPVTVTAGGLSSQAGVSLWVAPRLIMTGPSSGTGNAANTVSAQVGVALPSTNNAVAASGGTGNITYSVTSGLLPSGLSLVSSGGNAGLITGTPAAGTAGSYTVTVTATDSAPIPVTGTDTFVVTVAGGLFTTNTTPTSSTFGTANAAVATVTASGGVYPYTYSIANTISGHPLPATLTINAATGVISTTAATPAGTYLVKVTATDSTSGTPLTGSSTFTIVVGLEMTAAPTGAFSAGGGTTGAYNTMTTTGGSGTYTYSLDVASQAFVNANAAWLSFSSSTGVLTVATGSVQTTGFTVTVTATDSTTPANATAAGTNSVQFTFAIGS